MNVAYLDTNIFLYLSNKKSPYNNACKNLIESCGKKQLLTVTSTETIQEIIHYAKSTKQLTNGVKIATLILSLVDKLLPVTSTVIKQYLKLAKRHPTITSRDLIHAATCLTNHIPIIVTYDREFTAFTQIKSLNAKEFLTIYF